MRRTLSWGILAALVATGILAFRGGRPTPSKEASPMLTRADRFQRWQKMTLDQMGYALNLFLTLTVAALGYWSFLLKDPSFRPSPAAGGFMIAAVIALGISALVGLSSVINRLSDFRSTARRARENPEAPDKAELRLRGRVTWRLFYGQIASFAIGIATIAIALLLTYGSKLV